MAGQTLVTMGTRVRCRWGRPARAHPAVAMDEDSHRLIHLLLEEKGVLGRKHVTIPVSAVSRVDAGILLNITKRQVRHLPRVKRAFRDGQAS